MMIKKERNGIVWFEFELLQGYKGLSHAVFSRAGGISKPPFTGLNLSDTVGDDIRAVIDNRQRAFSAVNLFCPIVLANQVHGKNLYHASVYIEKAPETDALVTNTKQLALGIQHADCQAAIFFDPVHAAIGCVHAGWKGNCLNIYKETIDSMCRTFGSKAEDLIVCISPSLGPLHAEFVHYKKELPESFWPFKDSKNYFEGIPEKNIEIAGMCTFQDEYHFYSYRRDKPVTGRHLTAVWMA
jgi:YfiH family protein